MSQKKKTINNILATIPLRACNSLVRTPEGAESERKAAGPCKQTGRFRRSLGSSKGHVTSNQMHFSLYRLKATSLRLKGPLAAQVRAQTVDFEVTFIMKQASREPRSRWWWRCFRPRSFELRLV